MHKMECKRWNGQEGTSKIKWARENGPNRMGQMEQTRWTEQNGMDETKYAKQSW